LNIYEKSNIEGTILYIKTELNVFDDYFPCAKILRMNALNLLPLLF
jgi:hypothetical protein